MLSHHAIASIIQRVSYKPGWVLRAWEPDPIQGSYLSVTVELENSYRPGSTVPLYIHSPIPPMADQTALLTWLAWRLRVVETHELLEWLKVDDRPWIDPHASLDLDEPTKGASRDA